MSNITTLVSSVESLYTEIKGSSITSTEASNVNDITSVLSLVLSLVERNTSFDVETLLEGVSDIVDGSTSIIKVFKDKKTTTTTTTSTTSTTAS